MKIYINYVFSEIEHDDTMFVGIFETWGKKTAYFADLLMTEKQNKQQYGIITNQSMK